MYDLRRARCLSSGKINGERKTGSLWCDTWTNDNGEREIKSRVTDRGVTEKHIHDSVSAYRRVNTENVRITLNNRN